jgi:hypothetical protein
MFKFLFNKASKSAADENVAAPEGLEIFKQGFSPKPVALDLHFPMPSSDVSAVGAAPVGLGVNPSATVDMDYDPQTIGSQSAGLPVIDADYLPSYQEESVKDSVVMPMPAMASGMDILAMGMPAAESSQSVRGQAAEPTYNADFLNAAPVADFAPAYPPSHSTSHSTLQAGQSSMTGLDWDRPAVAGAADFNNFDALMPNLAPMDALYPAELSDMALLPETLSTPVATPLGETVGFNTQVTDQPEITPVSWAMIDEVKETLQNQDEKFSWPAPTNAVFTSTLPEASTIPLPLPAVTVSNPPVNIAAEGGMVASGSHMASMSVGAMPTLDNGSTVDGGGANSNPNDPSLFVSSLPELNIFDEWLPEGNRAGGDITAEAPAANANSANASSLFNDTFFDDTSFKENLAHNEGEQSIANLSDDLPVPSFTLPTADFAPTFDSPASSLSDLDAFAAVPDLGLSPLTPSASTLAVPEAADPVIALPVTPLPLSQANALQVNPVQVNPLTESDPTRVATDLSGCDPKDICDTVLLGPHSVYLIKRAGQGGQNAFYLAQQNADNWHVLKDLSHLGLKPSSSINVLLEGYAGNKEVYTVSVGNWKGILNADSNGITLHTELPAAH